MDSPPSLLNSSCEKCCYQHDGERPFLFSFGNTKLIRFDSTVKTFHLADLFFFSFFFWKLYVLHILNLIFFFLISPSTIDLDANRRRTAVRPPWAFFFAISIVEMRGIFVVIGRGGGVATPSKVTNFAAVFFPRSNQRYFFGGGGVSDPLISPTPPRNLDLMWY